MIQARSGRFLPLEESVKRTFDLAIEVWKLDHDFTETSEGFQAFVSAKSSRNRLTHPKTFYDIAVTDMDMHYYSVAFVWIREEFVSLLRKRTELLIQGLDADDQAAVKELCMAERPMPNPIFRAGALKATLKSSVLTFASGAAHYLRVAAKCRLHQFGFRTSHPGDRNRCRAAF